MCGIVGIFGLINKTRIGMFEDMLAMDGVRGRDSTGVAIITDKAVGVVKEAVLPDVILGDSLYKEWKKGKIRCLLGHNRAATLGKVTKDNAHPFQYKHITMVHNGTLENRWRLPDYWKYDTDSEAIAHCIADHGIEATWKVLEGAATLVWWDNAKQSLNVISNGKRPFFMQPLKDNNGVVWSSERWTLQVAALRSGELYHKPDKIYCPIVDKLYTFMWNPALKVFVFDEKQLEPFKFGNTVPGYKAHDPRPHYQSKKEEKKKKKRKNKRTGGEAIYVSKSAAESANVFQEWKDRYVERKTVEKEKSYPDDDFSDEAVKARYPELFDPALSNFASDASNNNKKDAELDTRAVPFRPDATKSHRTAERFKQLFDLVDLNATGKHMQAEFFLVNYCKCVECDGPFNYNDFFTARILSESKMQAICDLCQMDAWVISGIEPSQIRLQ
jgi:predicted glutamine amidotransferase